MIKAVGQIAGKTFLLIGLSAENITRLVDGQPIKFELPAPLDPTSNVIIIAGTTEEAIVEDLRKVGLVTADTEYHPDTDPATSDHH